MKWEEKDINKLKELSSKYYAVELASIFNVSENSIRSAAKRFNIKLIADNRNKWSEEKKKEFIELAKTHTAYELASIYNTSYHSVWNMAKKLNIKILKDTFWTEEKEQEFINLCKIYPLKEVSRIMNLNYGMLYSKALRMNIKLLDNNFHWSEEDLQYLRENWGTMNIETLANNLNRTKDATVHKAKELKLGAMIYGDYSVLRIEDICEIMGVERRTVTTYWAKLGLHVRKRRITKKTTYYYVEWEDLLSFLEEHQSIWDSRRVELYMLGEEYPWLKEKRINDAKRPTNINNPYECEEDILILKLLKKGKNYREIANILNRTRGAIETRVYYLGFNKETINELTNEHIEYIKTKSLKKGGK